MCTCMCTQSAPLNMYRSLTSIIPKNASNKIVLWIIDHYVKHTMVIFTYSFTKYTFINFTKISDNSRTTWVKYHFRHLNLGIQHSTLSTQIIQTNVLINTDIENFYIQTFIIFFNRTVYNFLHHLIQNLNVFWLHCNILDLDLFVFEIFAIFDIFSFNNVNKALKYLYKYFP